MKADVYWDGRIDLNFPRNSNDARRNVPIFYPTEGQNYFSSVCREKMSWPGEDNGELLFSRGRGGGVIFEFYGIGIKLHALAKLWAD